MDEWIFPGERGVCNLLLDHSKRNAELYDEPGTRGVVISSDLAAVGKG
jgi:hypothetical protein